jgi:ABC-2 type transport system ATP-binding protein
MKGNFMSPTILQTENLTKCYGTLTAVKNLSLEVREGEVFGFLGPNGAGKTTSINMICGLLKPDAGRVLLRGQPMASGDEETRSRVGMCPQSIVLWERLTCIEQLQFIGEMYGVKGSVARKRSERLLEELGLTDKRDKQARTLSGGMQRRLNLAMALVHDPEIVVLDEPEAGLDPQSRVKVREYIQSLARTRTRTVILTTHNMDEADRVVNRVAIIDHGELLVLDTPEVLKQRVGHGDVIEIRLSNGIQDEVKAREALQNITGDVTLEAAAQVLHVRALHAVGHVADILEALAAAGFQPGEVSIRANTLEDVFIQLTGRRLRE